MRRWRFFGDGVGFAGFPLSHLVFFLCCPLNFSLRLFVAAQYQVSFANEDVSSKPLPNVIIVRIRQLCILLEVPFADFNLALPSLLIFHSVFLSNTTYICLAKLTHSNKSGCGSMARASLKSLPALESGRPYWIEGVLLDGIGHVGEDSGFDSLQLRFSFCLLVLFLLLVQYKRLWLLL
jgi:hypothetical protein